jgi:hypothetical protein
MRRSLQSILIPVPEADPLVDGFRAEGDWSSKVGVPAHITLAGPFPLSEQLRMEPLAEVARRALGGSFTLDEFGRIGEATCLLLGDEESLRAVRGDLLATLGRPPDDDRAPRLHLTIARGNTEADVKTMREKLEPSLPLRCTVRDILVSTLIDERLKLASLSSTPRELAKRKAPTGIEPV